jgi:hypothetical protein
VTKILVLIWKSFYVLIENRNPKPVKKRKPLPAVLRAVVV